jgi:hypothetical protein
MNKVSQADLWRYITVYKHGGFYADTDSICCSPLDYVISSAPEGTELIVAASPGEKINNANFGALVKNNICMKELITHILDVYSGLTVASVFEEATTKDSLLEVLESQLFINVYHYDSYVKSHPDLVWENHSGVYHSSEIKNPDWSPDYKVDYYGKQVSYLDLVKENNWSLT